LARTLARQETPAEVWWVSDHNGKPSDDEESGKVRWVFLPVFGASRLNVGFTAFQLRPLPVQRAPLSCFLEVTANAVAGPGVDARIRMQIGGVSFPDRPLRLKGGESQVIEFPVEGKSGEVLHLSLAVDGDCLSADNEIRVRLPELKPVVAVRVGTRDEIDPFLHVALQSLVKERELQVWSAEPGQWPVQGADVVLFDHWLPQEWPEGVPVIVLDPPTSCGPVRVAPLRNGGIPQTHIRTADPYHPVLFRLSSDQLSVAQTCTIELSPGIQPLWTAGRETLLAAGERKGQRVVVMGFSPHQSTHLPLTESFPLLVGNAIYWSAEPAWKDSAFARQSLRTGTVLPVKGKQVFWDKAGGNNGQSSLVQGGVLELDQAGIWQTDAGETGAAHLLSSQETRDAGNALSPTETKGKSLFESAQKQWPCELTGLILGAVLLLLLLEILFLYRLPVG
jgi:hypothetical protein